MSPDDLRTGLIQGLSVGRDDRPIAGGMGRMVVWRVHTYMVVFAERQAAMASDAHVFVHADADDSDKEVIHHHPRAWEEGFTCGVV